jgi:hypothetical protein
MVKPASIRNHSDEIVISITIHYTLRSGVNETSNEREAAILTLLDHITEAATTIHGMRSKLQAVKDVLNKKKKCSRMREEDSEGPRRLTIGLAARGAQGALQMAIEAREVWQRKGSGADNSEGLFRLGVGAKANMSHVACKWPPRPLISK